MNIFTKFPLRLTIPLVLLVLVLLADVYTMKNNQHLADVEEEREALALVTQDMTQLQDHISDHLRRGNWEGVQSAIANRGANPNVQILVLVDEAGTIVGSTSLKLVGSAVGQALPEVNASVLKEVGATQAGRVVLTNDRRFVTAYYPVILGVKEGGFRPRRVGVLYLSYDITAAKATRRHDLERHALVMAGLYAGCFLLLGIFLQMVLTRRVGRLVTTARRFAAGDLAVQAGLKGEDELAQLGAAFDRMAEEIASSHEALKLTGAYNRSLIEASLDPLVTIDAAGKITDVNAATEKLTGYERATLIGTDFSDYFTDPAKARAGYRQVFGEGTVHNYELEVRHRDGLTTPVLYNATVYRDDAGKVVGVFAAARDITDRKRAEAELLKLNAELEQRVAERTADLDRKRVELQESELALMNLVDDLNQKTAELEAVNSRLLELDRLKSMFIASMSHELRTPLNSIIGFSSILHNEWTGPVNAEQKENLAIILRCGKHLLTLINDVIDVSKIEAGKIESTAEEFDLHDVMEEALSLVKKDLEEKGLALRTDIVHRQMFTDRRRLLQCVLNLLSNAVKFTDQGSITVTTMVAQCPGGMDVAEIVVTDTGIGIREEDLPKMFQPFVRLASPSVPGTGLGLYLTRKLAAEILNGDILLRSEYGKGSSFTIRMPVRLS